MKIKNALTLLILSISSLSALSTEKVALAEKKLAKHVTTWKKNRENSIGYPVNQEPHLEEFYAWFTKNNVMSLSMNNVGDPDSDSYIDINTHDLEREVIDYFAPKYGFSANNYWGFISDSGTDGNNHGLYFARKYLQSKSEKQPVAYVSKEAHFSVKKLADVQNLELKIIETSDMGQMDLVDFENKLVVDRPAIITVALGTTFKGAIDDQLAIRNILQKKEVTNFYIHLDAALFGGYLPFAKDQNAQKLVRQDMMGFDSIAVSGHKFFGFDNPLGIFLTRKEVYNNLNPFHVEYLGGKIPTITCSRSALAPLKFWWKIQTIDENGFSDQCAGILERAVYLKAELEKAGIKAWLNPYSNTVFFQRPKSSTLIDKYDLALEKSAQLGDLAHVVVMQHVSKEKIDQFVNDLKESETSDPESKI